MPRAAKILLVQPPQGSTFGLANILRIEPLGLECVGAALEAAEHEVQLVDMRLDDWGALGRRLERFGPAVIGVSCQFMTDVHAVLQVGAFLRARDPAATLVVGGHHASLAPDDMLFAGSPFDALVVGEGERTMVELVRAVESGETLGGAAGVMTRANRRDGFRRRRWIEDLDALPLPARHLTARYRRRYHHGTWVPAASVETSRGCPFDCNFCSVWSYYDRSVRRRSSATIVGDIETMAEQNVFFTDDIAFLHRDSYEMLGRDLAAQGIVRNFSAETRSDLIVKHRDLLPLWRRVGMRIVFLGIEKIDDAGLASVRKRTDTEQNARAIRLLQANDIRPMPSFIVDPQWSERDFDRLEAYLEEMELEQPAFTILTPLPGTELYDELRERLVVHDYTAYDVMHAVLPTRLPIERFYERFAGLYRYTARKARIGWPAVRSALELTARGYGFAFWRVFQALRDMKDPRAYMRITEQPRPSGGPVVAP